MQRPSGCGGASVLLPSILGYNVSHSASFARLERPRRSATYGFRPATGAKRLKGVNDPVNSIRMNYQWRICFVWTDAGPEEVEIVDYH